MIYVIYQTEKFKQEIQKLLKQAKVKSTKINQNDLKNIKFIKFATKLEDLFEIVDNSTGLIIEYVPNRKKKTVMLYSTARLLGLPTIISNAPQKTTITRDKLLTKTLRHYFTLHNKKQILYELQKMLIQAKNFQNPKIQLKAHESFITTTDPKSKLYYMYTETNKPVLFFFHGVTARGIAYLNTLKILQKYFDLYVLDLPYHGRSSKMTPKPKHLEDFGQVVVQAILNIVKKHNLKNRDIYIMGHSFGGALSLYAAYVLQNHKYNLNLKHLYLLTPAGAPIKQSQAKLFYLTTAKKLLNIEKYYTLRNELKRTVLEILMNYLRALEKQRKQKEFFDLLKIIPNGFKNFHKMIIKIPTTLIFADEDKYFDQEYKFSYIHNFECLQVKKAQGLHDWPIIQPQQLYSLIKDTLPKNTKTIQTTKKQSQLKPSILTKILDRLLKQP